MNFNTEASTKQLQPHPSSYYNRLDNNNIDKIGQKGLKMSIESHSLMSKELNSNRKLVCLHGNWVLMLFLNDSNLCRREISPQRQSSFLLINFLLEKQQGLLAFITNQQHLKAAAQEESCSRPSCCTTWIKAIHSG